MIHMQEVLIIYDPHISKLNNPGFCPCSHVEANWAPGMQFLNVASEAWFSTRAKHPCRNIHASKIKSPHESSTKTKWAQMAFKESHLAYATLGTWKTSELFYFVMPFFGWTGFSEIRKTNLGSESSASKLWPESSANFSQIPTTHWMISHPKPVL